MAIQRFKVALNNALFHLSHEVLPRKRRCCRPGAAGTECGVGQVCAAARIGARGL